MMKVLSCLLFTTTFLFAEEGFSQTKAISAYPSGEVREGLAVKSKLLNRDVNYSIYLPPDYQSSTRRYPVVYLLHGLTDTEIAWVQFGEVNLAADRAIANREIPPMIIVMPDAKATFYINNYTNSDRYEDMFFQEFIPSIDATYRTRASKEYRGVAGLSMGGYGTLIYALHHPDMFTACAAFSAAVSTDEDVIKTDSARWNSLFGKLYGGTTGTSRLTDQFRKNSILDLFKTLPKEKVSSVKYYIDCGDDDFLYRGNSTLHILLRDLNIPHEYRVRQGAHNWDYWRTGITEGLKFIGDNFHR